MATAFGEIEPRSRVNLLLFIAFLIVMILFGGASRADVLSQPVVRIAAIVMIVAAGIQLSGREWRRIRLPLFFIGGLAGLMVLQLVPLPPGLWDSLPGHGFYAESLAAAGLPPVWRPISMTPDLTLNSLLALLPALATIIALGAVQRSAHPFLLLILLGGILLGALVGLLQIGSGRPYLYAVTNEGSAVGFFANRNHQAVLLACALPILACWTAMPHADFGYRRIRIWLALCMAAAIFPLLLITGSRAGLVLGLVGGAVALPIALSGRRRKKGSAFTLRQAAIVLPPLLVGIGATGGAIYLARDVAVQRLMDGSGAADRTQYFPVFVQMIRDFFPFGSGFGSFNSIYRSYEQHEMLNLNYLNHAHNDWAQILIEGGVLALILCLGFLLWLLVRSWRVWSAKPGSSNALLGRTGTAIVLLLLISSLVDYPLRTPLLSTLMAIACFWMMRSPDSAPPSSLAPAGDKERVGSLPPMR